MTLEELINLINVKILNCKTNNFIITGLDSEAKRAILGSIEPVSPILNHRDIDIEDFSAHELTNVIIDLGDLEYFNILNFALDRLKISAKLKLETMRDLLRFRGLLRENEKAIQFIFCNVDKLNSHDARIFNLLLWLNTYFFNSIILLENGRDLSSYQVSDNTFLDNRENYTKQDIVKF